MMRRLVIICLVGVVLESLWVAIHAVGPLREHTGMFLQIIFAAFALCLWSYIRLPIPDNRTALLVIGFGLLFRLTVLPAEPYQSEDVYRYLWDARVASRGIDPFRYAPSAPELEQLRDVTLYPMLNSKPHITAYPPLSQMLFRACHALFGDRVWPMKAVFSLLEFAALVIAWRLLRALKRPYEPLYLMAWNPFFIFEFSHSGHSDSAMILLTLLSILLLHRGRNLWALASHTGAVLSKLHPALWFPLYVRRAGWKAGLVGFVTGLVVTLFYFTPAGLFRYLASLRLYYRLFEFNAGIHYFLCYVGRVWFQQSWDQRTGPFLLLVLVLIAAGICWKFPLRNASDVLHAGFWIMTADLCLATTVHPWYLSWAALALPVFPYLFMLYWTGAVFLSYLAYQYRPVYEHTWPLLIQYLPMYALMAYEIYRGGPLLEHRSDRNEP
jgi:alpha-1,6-mannosyltransferase